MILRLGSIPVRVRGPFLFLALVLGARLQRPDLIAIWVAIVFVSVLVHELGHAFVGKVFGLSPQIELHGMGGTTSWVDGRDVGHARSVAISLAGPFAGFALAGLLVLASRFGFKPHGAVGAKAFEMALEVNLTWGIFNLMPMLPLDGGNVVRSALNGLTKGRGEKAARTSPGAGGARVHTTAPDAASITRSSPSRTSSRDRSADAALTPYESGRTTPFT